MIDLLKEYGPAFLALVIAYYRDKAAEARSKQRIAELELKIKENHEKVEAGFAGKSDGDVVDSISKRSA